MTAPTFDAVSGWTIARIDVATAPDCSGFWIDPSGESMALTLAGVGTITVSVDGATSHAPDAQLHATLAATCGQWAWGQWLGFHRTFAFHGATLERDGYGIALFGAPRAGVSLAALALSRRGWTLVADGTCPLVLESDAAGEVALVALAGQPGLQVDSAVTDTFPPPENSEPARTLRRRTNIATDASEGAARINRILMLITSNVRTTGVVVAGGSEELNPAAKLHATAVLGDARQAADQSLTESVATFCQQTVDTVPLDGVIVPAGTPSMTYTPKQIADLITTHLALVDGVPLAVPGD